jgi:hypothetical protein
VHDSLRTSHATHHTSHASHHITPPQLACVHNCDHRDLSCSADDNVFRFANFIQRQMFVLRTYRSRTERWVNLFLMWLTATTSATLGFNMLVSSAAGYAPVSLWNSSFLLTRHLSTFCCFVFAILYFPRIPQPVQPSQARTLLSLLQIYCCYTAACICCIMLLSCTYAASRAPPFRTCARRLPSSCFLRSCTFVSLFPGSGVRLVPSQHRMGRHPLWHQRRWCGKRGGCTVVGRDTFHSHFAGEE